MRSRWFGFRVRGLTGWRGWGLGVESFQGLRGLGLGVEGLEGLSGQGLGVEGLGLRAERRAVPLLSVRSWRVCL